MTFDNYTTEDLRRAVQDIDVEKYPGPTRALLSELLRRLEVNVSAENVVHSSAAVARGARFGELDAMTKASVFWPYFWRSTSWCLLIGFVFGFIESVLAQIVQHIQLRMGVMPINKLWVQLVVSALVAVPMSKLWLRVLCSWKLGEHGIRFVRIE